MEPDDSATLMLEPNEQLLCLHALNDYANLLESLHDWNAFQRLAHREWVDDIPLTLDRDEMTVLMRALTCFTEKKAAESFGEVFIRLTLKIGVATGKQTPPDYLCAFCMRSKRVRNRNCDVHGR